jgi:hypothetical protein
MTEFSKAGLKHAMRLPEDKKEPSQHGIVIPLQSQYNIAMSEKSSGLSESILKALTGVEKLHFSEIVTLADSKSKNYKTQNVYESLNRLVARGLVERVRRGFYSLKR